VRLSGFLCRTVLHYCSPLLVGPQRILERSLLNSSTMIQVQLRTTLRKRCRPGFWPEKCYHTVVAISGGVDSSVTAGLLKSTNPTALFMANWNAQQDDSLTCTTEHDWRDVEEVCRKLKLEDLRRQSFERDYWVSVFEPFVEEILKGRMGNPDIDCNTFIKFGCLLDFCLEKFGPETKLATGHYARLYHDGPDNEPLSLKALEDATRAHPDDNWVIDQSSGDGRGPTLLLSSRDLSKDQTYFLSQCSGHRFRSVRFPLGNYFKSRPFGNETTVRQMATAWGLHTSTKKDSTGICFVGSRTSFRSFVGEYMPPPSSPVDICDIDTGARLATTPSYAHAVLYSATPGQGAKLPGASTKYFFTGDVTIKSHGNNEVFVCAGTHHPCLYSDYLTLERVNWIAGVMPRPLARDGSWRAQCRIRHLQPLMDCTVKTTEDGRLHVSFDKPVRGITFGQHCVFYGLGGLVCLGGGPIDAKGPSYWERGIDLPALLASSGHNDLSLSRVASE